MNKNTIWSKTLLSLVSLSCLSPWLAWPMAVSAREHHHKKTEENNFAPCMSWTVPKPRAILLCVHGLGLDSTAYTGFANKMNSYGISSYAIDVRGFGSWMRAAGHEQVDFDACLDDVKKALSTIRAANVGVPIFLVGESMGGAIALHGAAHFPELMDGVISSVPAAERFQEKRTDLKVALDFLKGPNKDFDIGDSIVDQATKNEKLRAAWEADPLSRMNLSPHELLQFQRFMNSNHDIAKDITMPVLMLQGTMDRLVKPQGSFELFSKLSSVKKIFIALPSEHLILEDQKAHTVAFDSRVAALLMGWINANLGDNAAAVADLAQMPAKPASDTPGQTAPLDTSDQPKVPATAEPVKESEKQIVIEQKEDKLLDTAIGASDQIQNTFDPFEREMALALVAMREGRKDEAQKLLQAIVQSEPLNADAHYWLSLCLVAQGQTGEAKKEKELARSLAKISGRSKQVKNYVLASSNNGSQTSAPVDPKELTNGVPTVLVFQAGWCAECQGLDTLIKQAQNNRGNSVRFLSFDVDNKDNNGIVKLFNIGPIPTFVFLRGDGTTSSTIIGRETLPTIQRELQVITSRTKN